MGNTVNNTNELIVSSKNEVGALAKCLLSLKENNINVECFCCYTEGNSTKFHFVTSNNQKAKDVWKKTGFKVDENSLVGYTASNTPGTIFNATSALAEAKIDIYYTYCSTPHGSNNSYVVFNTSNNDMASKVLANTDGCCSSSGSKTSNKGGCCG